MTTRSLMISVTTELITEECCNCGVLFAITREMHDRLLSEGRKASFFCPNGHSQHYLKESDADKAKRLQAELDKANEEKASLRQSVDHAWAQYDAEHMKVRESERKRRIAERRAAAAVCPVPGCKRQIIQMKRHLESKHPGYLDAVHGDH